MIPTLMMSSWVTSQRKQAWLLQRYAEGFVNLQGPHTWTLGGTESSCVVPCRTSLMAKQQKADTTKRIMTVENNCLWSFWETLVLSRRSWQALNTFWSSDACSITTQAWNTSGTRFEDGGESIRITTAWLPNPLKSILSSNLRTCRKAVNKMMLLKSFTVLFFLQGAVH